MDWNIKMIKRYEKYCGDCKLVKPKTEFHKRKASKDGLAFRCKPCSLKYATWYRTKYPKTEEQLAEGRRYNKVYAEANRDRINAQRRKVRHEQRRIELLRSDNARKELL